MGNGHVRSQVMSNPALKLQQWKMQCNDVPLLFAGNLATPHFWATPAATEPQPFPPTKKSQTFPTEPKKKKQKKTSS